MTTGFGLVTGMNYNGKMPGLQEKANAKVGLEIVSPLDKNTNITTEIGANLGAVPENMQNLQPGAYVKMGVDYSKTNRNYRKNTISTLLAGGDLGVVVDKANTSNDMMKTVIINQNTNQNTPNPTTPNNEVVHAQAYAKGYAGAKMGDLTVKADAKVANNWIINDEKTDQFVSFGLGLNAEYNIPGKTGKGRFSTRKNDSGVTIAAGFGYEAPVTAFDKGGPVANFGVKISIENAEYKRSRPAIFEAPKLKRRKR